MGIEQTKGLYAPQDREIDEFDADLAEVVTLYA